MGKILVALPCSPWYSVTMKTSITLEEAQALTRMQRHRLRKQGVHVPAIPHRKGYTLTPEQRAKAAQWAEDHPAWKGDKASVKAGRSRALRLFPPQPCSVCGKARAERHHLDGNTLNNDPGNIMFVCRKCHMAKDGRHEQCKRWAKSRV